MALHPFVFLLLGAVPSANDGTDARSWDRPARSTPRIRQEDSARLVLGELLVRYADGAARARIVRFAERSGDEVLGEIPRLRWLRIGLGEPSGNAAADERAREDYAAVAGAEEVGFSRLGRGGEDVRPNDPQFSVQYPLENTGQSGGEIGADVEALPGWTEIRGSSEVVLAVIDSGIDFAHPEFQGRLQQGYDFVDEDNDPTAEHSHGIHVTGIAAANADNAFQVAGVDHHCQVLPLRVLDKNNSGTDFDLAQALDHCAVVRPDVVNMSLIDYGDGAILKDALAAAHDAGCILISCSGNGGLGDADVSWPGASDRTISIGATDRIDHRATFSGTGNALDFVAPGVDVPTVKTTYDEGYEEFTGCSAATPMASGIVCLLKAYCKDLDQDSAYRWLLAGAEDQVGKSIEDVPGWDPYHGNGRLNLRRSLEALLEANEWTATQRLVSPSSERGGRFGIAIAAHDGNALVGASHETTGAADSGRVHRFQFSGKVWQPVESWQSPSPDPGEHFGSAVALDGDWAAVAAADRAGTFATEAGAVFLFHEDQGTWTFQQEIDANDAHAFDHYGTAVALAGTHLAAGAPDNDQGGADSGSCYLYERTGSAWNLAARFDGISAGEGFGASIALEGDQLLVAAPRADGAGADSGRVDHYEWNGQSWARRGSIVPPDSEAGQLFGTALALRDGLLAVGAPGTDGGRGAVYEYQWSNQRWTLREEHRVEGAEPGDSLGSSVDVHGPTVVCGASGVARAGDAAGAVYAFEHLATGDVRIAALVARFASAGDRAGAALALAGTDLLVGARLDARLQQNSGTVQVWRPTGLDLAADRVGPSAGDKLELRTVGGLAGAPAYLFLVAIEGAPQILSLARGGFDAAGVFAVTNTVPPGLALLDVSMVGLGWTQPGKLEITDTLVVRFR